MTRIRKRVIWQYYVKLAALQRTVQVQQTKIEDLEKEMDYLKKSLKKYGMYEKSAIRKPISYPHFYSLTVTFKVTLQIIITCRDIVVLQLHIPVYRIKS